MRSDQANSLVFNENLLKFWELSSLEHHFQDRNRAYKVNYIKKMGSLSIFQIPLDFFLKKEEISGMDIV